MLINQGTSINEISPKQNGTLVLMTLGYTTVVTKYQKRISGPLLDRIDIHIEVPRVDYEKLSNNWVGESSASIKKRVQVARNSNHRIS
jgi:predicted ATPase with chaperone activity